MADRKEELQQPVGFSGLADLVSDGSSEAELLRARSDRPQALRSAGGQSPQGGGSVVDTPARDHPNRGGVTSPPSRGIPPWIWGVGGLVLIMAWSLASIDDGTPSSSQSRTPPPTRAVTPSPNRATPRQTSPRTNPPTTNITPPRSQPTSPPAGPRVVIPTLRPTPPRSQSTSPPAGPRVVIPTLRPTPSATPSSSRDPLWAEIKPPVGKGRTLDKNQIRYCSAESIRIDAADPLVNVNSQSEIDQYNALVEDYNSRCISYQYLEGVLQSVEREIESRRGSLVKEGQERVLSWRKGRSLTEETEQPAPAGPTVAFQGNPAAGDPVSGRQPTVPGAKAGGLAIGVDRRLTASESKVGALSEPDLTGLNGAERTSIESACSAAKYLAAMQNTTNAYHGSWRPSGLGRGHRI